jgi:hypothetical protein
MIRKILIYTLMLVLPFGFWACPAVKYSFTGGGQLDAKTVVISYFTNKASVVNPTLSQVFTEKLKDKFIKESKLQLVTTDGDWAFSGFISGYTTVPVAIQSDNKAQQTRLTISVNVKFENKKDPKKNFDQAFSSFSDFDNSKNLSEVESSLIDEITTKLVQDIYTKTALDW